jgi:hypothetical protein
MQPIDVVYLLGENAESDFLEFRLSIRSLEKFYAEKIRDIYTVGHKPSWTKNVAHVPFLDSWASKDASLIAKTTYACYLKEISDPFLLMSDDIFLMRDPTDLLDKIFCEKLDEGQWKNWSTAKNVWLRRNFSTREVVKYRFNDRNPPFLDPHIGLLIHKDHYARTMLQVGWDYEKRGGGINTNYYQYACLYDQKINKTEQKLGVRFLNQTKNIEAITNNQEMLWLNISNETLYGHAELFPYLIKNFENISKYELPESGEKEVLKKSYIFAKEKYNSKLANSARLQGLN